MAKLSILSLALWATTITAQAPPPPVYTPVPYQDAPSYYPGAPYTFPPASTRNKTCKVTAPANGGDAAPNIIKAFDDCKQNAKVVFANITYTINSTMEVQGLKNVEVEILGTLLWTNDTDYWLGISLDEGYQNQSTAFIFGGDQVHMYGHGYGTLDGNGQAWYECCGSVSNYPGRPHQITFRDLTNSVIEGVRFVQSQMWTMTIMHANNVLLQDIYINSTNLAPGRPLTGIQNTDGVDTLYANNITFARWIVSNGDDSISPKANSTNLLAEDCTFYGGNSIALGSIGQYEGQYEQIVNVTVRNIYANRTRYAMYAKTWTGTKQGNPPNGGGGGLGMMSNITMSNVIAVDIGPSQAQLFNVQQCLGCYNPDDPTCEPTVPTDCDSSTFQVEDVRLRDVHGTILTSTVASIQCSAAVPCPGIEISGLDITMNGEVPTGYLCSNVTDPIGFECNGKPALT